MGHIWKNWSHAENWVTLKNRSLSENWITLGKIYQIPWVTPGKVGNT